MEKRGGRKAAKVIRTLSKLLSKANAAAGGGSLGCCVYDPGTGITCADGWTQDQCDAVKGQFSPGQTCKQTGGGGKTKLRKRRVMSAPLADGR
jgi:hypothetical protein